MYKRDHWCQEETKAAQGSCLQGSKKFPEARTMTLPRHRLGRYVHSKSRGIAEDSRDCTS